MENLFHSLDVDHELSNDLAAGDSVEGRGAKKRRKGPKERAGNEMEGKP